MPSTSETVMPGESCGTSGAMGKLYTPSMLRLASTFEREGSLVACPHCRGRGILYYEHEEDSDYRWHECASCCGWGSIALPMQAAQQDRFEEGSYAHARLFNLPQTTPRLGPHGIVSDEFPLTAKQA